MLFRHEPKTKSIQQFVLQHGTPCFIDMMDYEQLKLYKDSFVILDYSDYFRVVAIDYNDDMTKYIDFQRDTKNNNSIQNQLLSMVKK